ncbi:MAG: FecCD family ABC transporter permease [Promethearchaeota archaeon]
MDKNQAPVTESTVPGAKAIEDKYVKHKKRKYLVIGAISFTLILFILFALSLGSATLTLNEIFQTLAGNGDIKSDTIIFKIRLPRIIASILVGIALSVSGSIVQCILRNPLGSPYTLGISPAASFGAAFAVIVLGAGSIHSAGSDAVLLDNPYIVTTSAFFWCLIGTFIILVVVKYKGARPETMVLMGIIIGSLFNALTTALEYFAEDVQLASIIHWTFGDLSRGTWTDVLIILVIVLPATIYFIYNSLYYNALDAGNDVAHSLGVNCNRIRITSMVIASLTISVVVAFYGIIAFVGLIVPHLVRKFLKSNDAMFVLPTSAIFGGLFVLMADTLARIIIAPLVLPVGVLTSFLGAPMFIYLLIRKNSQIR